jgi:hypothetical protein
MIPCWKAAILAIMVRRNNPFQDRHRIGYFFPDQRIFHDQKNRSAFVATWLGCRLAHLKNCLLQNIGIINKEQWRLFLNAVRQRFPRPTAHPPQLPASLPQLPASLPQCHASLPQPPLSVRARPSKQRNSRPAHVIASLDSPGLSSSGTATPETRRQSAYLERMTALLQDVNSVVWFDQEFHFASNADTNAIPAAVVAEAQWEMAELVFRFELRHIDRCLAPQEWAGGNDMDRDNTLCAVFPREGEGLPGGYSLSTFPNRNSGLASSNSWDRRRAILAFQSIVKSWPDCPGDIKAAPTPTDDLFTKITLFYCQTFFDCFGRPPVVPHRLPAASLARSSPRPFLDSLKHVE